MTREDIHAELLDAITDFLEHADNAGETESWAGLDPDDVYALEVMIEERTPFAAEDWLLAKRVLDYRINDLREISNGDVHLVVDIAYFDEAIARVEDAAEAIDWIVSP